MVVKISSTGGSGLFTIDTNGAIVTFVGSVSGGHFAVFSPDGTRIAYGEAPGSNDNNYEVSAINVDGTGYTNLTQSPGVDLSPSWSPDGTRIAFMDYSGDGDIHVINADGTGEVNLGTPGYARLPAWSPDGTTIAFLSRQLGSWDEVYVMNADGSGVTQVMWSESAAGAPSWQPIDPNQPPECVHLSVEPRSLQPADKRYVKVRLSAVGDPRTITVTGVTQDEPVGRFPDAKLRPHPDRVFLRAEHSQSGDGRVYHVAYTATDDQGGECTGVARVEVRQGEFPPAVDSAPPSYDSLTPSTTP